MGEYIIPISDVPDGTMYDVKLPKILNDEERPSLWYNGKGERHEERIYFK